MDFEAKAKSMMVNAHGDLVRPFTIQIAQALREAYEQGCRDENEACAKVADAYEERKWRTLGEGGDLSGCGPRNIARSIRELSPNACQSEEKK